MDVLKELNAIALIHGRPDAGETAVIDRAFDNDSKDANDHEAGLHDIRPHDSFHTALETTHTHKLL